MFFSLILENQSGDCIDMTTTANQYITSQIRNILKLSGQSSISGVSLSKYALSSFSIIASFLSIDYSRTSSLSLSRCICPFR